MAFNTTSFVAGASAVVAVLSTGLAGGYYLASPSHIAPPNRLQRLAAADQDSKPAAVTTQAPAAAKPEIVADVAPAVPAAAAAVPSSAPVVAPQETKASEPAPTATIQETAAPAPMAKPDRDAKATEKVSADKARAVEARSADARAADRYERKRSETRKIAEQQRKQRELDVATVAVRRIIHERGPSDIVADSDQAEAPAPEMTHFNLFGQ